MMMQPGHWVTTTGGRTYTLEKPFPIGGQGTVFPVLEEAKVVKLYHSHVLPLDKWPVQRMRLEGLIRQGRPFYTFVWPEDIVDGEAYGYVTPRVDPAFVSLLKLNWTKARLQT